MNRLLTIACWSSAVFFVFFGETRAEAFLAILSAVLSVSTTMLHERYWKAVDRIEELAAGRGEVRGNYYDGRNRE